ncbi:MAG: DnaJ C-terminal domain-containing protein [Hyphomicrobiaceae bacterium]
MADRKLYDLLGVKPDVSNDDLRKAYRKLAKELHPDLNPGNKEAEERFKAITAAYDILKDAESRGRYDRGEIDASGQERPRQDFYRHHAESANPGNHAYQSSAGYEDFSDFSDIFAEAMRRRQRAEPADMPGEDAAYNMSVDFLDAANGATQRVTMPDGVVLDIKIPAGVEEGQVLRLRGKGHPGRGKGKAGDALVLIAIRPHSLFKRDGDTISIEVPVAINEAVLGGRIEVPTLRGSVRMKLPKGTQNGQTMRLKGQGIKRGDIAGDMLVSARIVMPETVDPDLEAFFEKWQAEHAYDPRTGSEFTS